MDGIQCVNIGVDLDARNAEREVLVSLEVFEQMHDMHFQTYRELNHAYIVEVAQLHSDRHEPEFRQRNRKRNRFQDIEMQWIRSFEVRNVLKITRREKQAEMYGGKGSLLEVALGG